LSAASLKPILLGLLLAVFAGSKKGEDMTTEKEFFNIKYKQGSLDPKTAQLVFFAACIAIGHEGGARRHLKKARECGATEDEITEVMVYAMRPAAAKVRDLAKAVIAN
jgi:alkylhydroperoxidase/carboxymuconolactone decarboxylase family protein YurZ